MNRSVISPPVGLMGSGKQQIIKVSETAALRAPHQAQLRLPVKPLSVSVDAFTLEAGRKRRKMVNNVFDQPPAGEWGMTFAPGTLPAMLPIPRPLRAPISAWAKGLDGMADACAIGGVATLVGGSTGAARVIP